MKTSESKNLILSKHTIKALSIRTALRAAGLVSTSLPPHVCHYMTPQCPR